jgi:hypothetical protein
VDIQSTTASLPVVGSTATAALANPAGAESTLGGIADQLGMTVAGVQVALGQGESIASLGEHKGVARESLAQFIQGQIQRARTTNGQPPLDQTTLDRMVDRALDRGRRPADAEAGGSGAEEAAPGTYSSNARATSAGLPTGGTVSLLA